MLIDNNTTLSDLVHLLEGAGLRIASVRRERGRYVVVLDIEKAHAIDGKVRACEGSGATLAEAIEDARFGLVGWAAYIVVSASFILQVNLWLSAKLGSQFLAGVFWVFSLLVTLAAVAFAVMFRLGIVRVSAVIGVFALAYLLTTVQAHFAEKTHVISYGLLGLLAARDLTGASGAARLKGAAPVMAFVVFVSLADEIFQWALPYRYFEINDIMTNVVSGALGMGLFLALGKRR